MVDEVADFLGADFKVLWFGLPAINDGGHTPGGAQFLARSDATASGDMLSTALISSS